MVQDKGFEMFEFRRTFGKTCKGGCQQEGCSTTSTTYYLERKVELEPGHIWSDLNDPVHHPSKVCFIKRGLAHAILAQGVEQRGHLRKSGGNAIEDLEEAVDFFYIVG